ncbi:hypothetical protein GCM10023197_15370 [Gordonia humi]
MVVGTVVGLIAVNAVLYGFAGGHLPFHASSLVDPPTGDAIVRADLMYLEVAALAVMVYLFTRRREVPDIAERAPDRSRAGREIVAVVAYGAAVLVVGSIIGALCGWHAFGLHLDNMVIRSGDPVTPAEAICWAAYNVVAYAVIPLVVFGRRYSAEQLNLRSSDRRADLMLIVAVLVVESAVQLAVSDSTILDLTARQALIGAPVTFVLSFAGTVLPAMVFIYCILVPRFLRVTGSVPATVVLGGVTYALLHVVDGWTDFTSPSDAVLSVAYVLLFYTGPGMFKTFITVRTANAWTHVWAYHAIAPHTLVDTPMFVGVFGIR